MKTDLPEKLAAMTLFSEFTREEISIIADLAELAPYKKGDLIVAQDTPGDIMFVIIGGTVKVLHQADDRRLQLAALGAGDFFGELALVDQGPRSADVEAATDCVLMKIPQGSIRALAGVCPNAAFKFLIAVGRVLVKRMRAGNKKYIDSLLLSSGRR